MILALGGDFIKSYNKFFNSEQKTNQKATDNENKMDTKTTKEDTPIIAVVNCKLLNVREAPSKDSNIICVLSEQQRVIMSPIYDIEIDDAWAHIKLLDGTYGYVMGEFLKQI